MTTPATTPTNPEKITTDTTPPAITAAEATAYLTAHGFTRAAFEANCYHHRNTGNATVQVVDAQAACFAVYAFTRDRARLLLWQAQLTNTPLPVFAATVNAAIA